MCLKRLIHISKVDILLNYSLTLEFIKLIDLIIIKQLFLINYY